MRLIIILILLQSCSSYETLPDGRKYTLKDSCLSGHIESYNYTTMMIVGKTVIPQVHSGTRYVCDSLQIDTVFINEK